MKLWHSPVTNVTYHSTYHRHLACCRVFFHVVLTKVWVALSFFIVGRSDYEICESLAFILTLGPNHINGISYLRWSRLVILFTYLCVLFNTIVRAFVDLDCLHIKNSMNVAQKLSLNVISSVNCSGLKLKLSLFTKHHMI
jgi:hypothetical protein